MCLVSLVPGTFSVRCYRQIIHCSSFQAYEAKLRIGYFASVDPKIAYDGLLSSVHARYELDPTTRLFGGVTLKTNSDSSPYKFTLRQGIEKDLGGITLAPWLQEELTTNQPDYTAGIKFEVPVYGSKVFLGLSKHISGPKINNDRITLGLTKLF